MDRKQNSKWSVHLILVKKIKNFENFHFVYVFWTKQINDFCPGQFSIIFLNAEKRTSFGMRKQQQLLIESVFSSIFL